MTQQEDRDPKKPDQKPSEAPKQDPAPAPRPMNLGDLFGDIRVAGLVCQWIPGTLNFEFRIGDGKYLCRGAPGNPDPAIHDEKSSPLFIDIPAPLVTAVQALLKQEGAPIADGIEARAKIIEAAQRQMDRARTGFDIYGRE